MEGNLTFFLAYLRVQSAKSLVRRPPATIFRRGSAFARFPQFSLALPNASALIDPHLMEAALKTEYTKEFKLHEKDTGSADVQIALLTHRINDLTKHLQKFKKDHSSRRGLLMMVAQRKKLQDYLKKSDSSRYDKVIQKLNLRK
jgi:small subunit ribosomal protein S15